MDAPNASDLFCKAVNEGSVFQLKVLREIHGRKGIMANFTSTSCNEQGDTCLKMALESEFYDVLEFLVHQLKGHIMCGLYKTWKASIKNVSPFSWETYTFNEVTEPFVLSPDIAIIRDICHQMPITRVIEYLIDVGCDEPLWLEFVLNSIMASSIPRPDKIVALECLGTAFVFKQTHYLFQRKNVLNEIRFWRGPRCWKEALILRNSTADGDPAIPKVPFEQSEMLRNAFGDIAEITTVEELEQLEQQWCLTKELEEWQILRQSLEAQALLVGHRIFTRQTNTGLNSFHLENLVLFANNFSKEDSRAFNIYLVILDQSYGFTSTSPHKCVGHFVRTIYGLLILFDKLWADQQDHLETREIASKNLVQTVKYTLATLANVSSAPPHFSLVDRTWQLDIQKKIYVLLSKWLSSLTKEHTENLKECLVPFFRVYNSNHGFLGLLHLAVNGHLDRPATSMTTYSTTVQLIQLLLKAGADPQITDINDKTPFHCLFDGLVWTCARSNLKTVFKALLDAGGHLDQATSSGRTVISLIKSWRTSTLPFANLVRDPYFDSFIYSVLPLSCSCAQVIRRNQIPFENQLPPRLKLFVLRHSEFKTTRMKRIQL